MNRNLIWKAVLIIFVAVLAAWNVYPPQEKLKLGIDLAGGTSLIYEIDTTGMKVEEQKGLAQSMIPILLKRIDPRNMANIVMHPQGNNRIEIKLPVASEDTRNKRQAYEDSLKALEDKNINLLKILKSLSYDATSRQEVFESFARGDEERKAILANLANVYDQRSEKQVQRDQLDKKNEEFKKQVEAEDLSSSLVDVKLTQWSKLEGTQRTEEIEKFVRTYKPSTTEDSKEEAALNEEQQKIAKLLNDYTETYNQWAEVVNELAESETGLNVQWDRAVKELGTLNLNITQLTEILDLPESKKRSDYIESFKNDFPSRVGLIDEVVSAHKEYSAVGGRLDDPEDLKRMLKGAGVLEFRILPTTADSKSNAAELLGYVEALQTKGPKMASDNRYVWCELEDKEKFPKSYQKIGDPILGTFGEKDYVLASNQVNDCMLHSGESEWKLKRAYRSTDEMGRRAIGFTHDTTGGSIFYNVTRKNIGRPLAILLDGLVISAPTISTAIQTQGNITGDFTQTEVDDMINKLNAGSFRAKLSEVPISEKSIGATIGTENRDKGITAGFIGLACVAAFMLAYYLFAGAIADVALFMNILLVLGMMAMFNATFTLPGIAGLILTIGMSVDANVLIFERIREEQLRGSSLRTGIANGYQRAFRTIFDANITTFITALILYLVASEEIKGFAIVLMLGIASSMFTALFVTRVVFDFLVGRRIIKEQLPMLRLISTPNIDWMGLRKIFFALSVLLIVGGLAVFFTRDETQNSKYDIEFTGGTTVQIKLKPDPSHTRSFVESAIRQKGTELGNDALAAAKVYNIDKEDNYQFEISTTATNNSTVKVSFNNSTGETVETVTAAIKKAAEETGSTFGNLIVSKGGDSFTISTSQLNKAAVSNVMTKAFESKASISEIKVDEVVSQAVRDAFEGLLEVREDLGPNISEVREVTDSDLELSDFLGGIIIRCDLEKSTTSTDLKSRFEDILFKRDMEGLPRYTYKLFDSELSELGEGQEVSTFLYVSVHPEAGYREFDENEWSRFVEGEKTRVEQAASLKASLSRVTQIDPSIGKQQQYRAIIAIILSLIAIVGYIWIRFGTARYGFAAIAALVHDVCITLGAVTVCTYIAGTPLGRMLGVMDFKINLETIAAFLTIIGYSLNDTIVVFDRIRENRGKLSLLNPQILTNSINQTLSRTLLTSFTTFIVVLVMYIWGGAGLRGFTFALLVGIVIGTYSSIAIASPILLIGSNKKETELRKK